MLVVTHVDFSFPQDFDYLNFYFFVVFESLEKGFLLSFPVEIQRIQ